MHRMTCEFRMSWDMLRAVKTFFTALGIPLFSVGEQKLRENMKEATQLYKTGTVTFEKQTEEKGTVKLEKTEVEFIWCTDVRTQLETIMKGHALNQRVIQRSAITGVELRLTLLGDKGGAYTKLFLSIWDVMNSQSPLNGMLLAMYHYGEEYDLIKEVFGPVIKQLNDINTINLQPSIPPPRLVLPSAQKRSDTLIAKDRSNGMHTPLIDS